MIREEKANMKHSARTPQLVFPEMSEDPWLHRHGAPVEWLRLSPMNGFSTLELCAGAGGQALGYEQAGFEHTALVEIDKHACATLRLNRPTWNVVEGDLAKFDGRPYQGVDVISGGLPCPPFSVAGKQLGANDERNLFPEMIRLVDEIRPRAVMIENVRGILDAVFSDYRQFVGDQLKLLGYTAGWRLMNASDFGVPQLRPRVVFVAMRKEYSDRFIWPEPQRTPPPTVGEVLYDLIAANGWKDAGLWRQQASEIAPTVVGGSHKHGGPDLGPTRARRAWATLGVDGLGIANEAPAADFTGMPRLTVRMVARIQGFPDEWQFSGGKTAAYRQVGNAFPPPFARAVATAVANCLSVPKLVRIAG
jgi:DNA (cytosine-5)-methyltransferase 1